MDKINKIYARLDKNNVVIKMFSSVFERPLDTDKLVEEGNEEYHAHVHLKYTVRDESGNYNYKYENSTLVELTDEEKETLFPAPTPEPNAQDILNAQLLKSKAEITTQLDNQKTLNAQLLLDIAKLKGGN